MAGWPKVFAISGWPDLARFFFGPTFGHAYLAAPETTSKLLDQLVGNLGYAAWVEPFCRPLLSCLALHIVRNEPAAKVPLTPLMVIALRIWHLVLSRNRGLHFDFILGRLPEMTVPIFVDASSS